MFANSEKKIRRASDKTVTKISLPQSMSAEGLGRKLSEGGIPVVGSSNSGDSLKYKKLDPVKTRRRVSWSVASSGISDVNFPSYKFGNCLISPKFGDILDKTESGDKIVRMLSDESEPHVSDTDTGINIAGYSKVKHEAGTDVIESSDSDRDLQENFISKHHASSCLYGNGSVRFIPEGKIVRQDTEDTVSLDSQECVDKLHVRPVDTEEEEIGMQSLDQRFLREGIIAGDHIKEPIYMNLTEIADHNTGCKVVEDFSSFAVCETDNVIRKCEKGTDSTADVTSLISPNITDPGLSNSGLKEAIHWKLPKDKDIPRKMSGRILSRKRSENLMRSMLKESVARKLSEGNRKSYNAGRKDSREMNSEEIYKQFSDWRIPRDETMLRKLHNTQNNPLVEPIYMNLLEKRCEITESSILNNKATKSHTRQNLAMSKERCLPQKIRENAFDNSSVIGRTKSFSENVSRSNLHMIEPGHCIYRSFSRDNDIVTRKMSEGILSRTVSENLLRPLRRYSITKNFLDGNMIANDSRPVSRENRPKENQSDHSHWMILQNKSGARDGTNETALQSHSLEHVYMNLLGLRGKELKDSKEDLMKTDGVYTTNNPAMNFNTFEKLQASSKSTARIPEMTAQRTPRSVYLMLGSGESVGSEIPTDKDIARKTSETITSITEPGSSIIESYLGNHVRRNFCKDSDFDVRKTPEEISSRRKTSGNLRRPAIEDTLSRTPPLGNLKVNRVRSASGDTDTRKVARVRSASGDTATRKVSVKDLIRAFSGELVSRKSSGESVWKSTPKVHSSRSVTAVEIPSFKHVFEKTEKLRNNRPSSLSPVSRRRKKSVGFLTELTQESKMPRHTSQPFQPEFTENVSANRRCCKASREFWSRRTSLEALSGKPQAEGQMSEIHDALPENNDQLNYSSISGNTKIGSLRHLHSRKASDVTVTARNDPRDKFIRTMSGNMLIR